MKTTQINWQHVWCEITFQGSIEVRRAFGHELLVRGATTAVSSEGTFSLHVVKFRCLNEHSILRAFAICEEFRVKYNLGRVLFYSTHGGATHFVSHERGPIHVHRYGGHSDLCDLWERASILGM